jgi:hypothetical protein
MFINKFFNALKRRGSIIMLTAFASIFLVSMTALVTDVGYMYYSQSRLQTAVNAGWKAGYDRMMQLKADDGKLDEDEKTQVIAHIKEVMTKNGYTSDELANLVVTFGPNNHLEITSIQDVGLFFARAMDFNSAKVSASRQNHEDDTGEGIVPFAIPHGVTKDLSKNTYICELYNDLIANPIPGVTEFIPGQEYILKLGSGGKKDPNAPEPVVLDPGKLFIPMDQGAQTAAGFLSAYGAVFWCLRIDSADPGFVPVEWLIGYRGGSFFLPNHAEVKSILKSYSVNYQEILDEDQIQGIYDVVGSNMLEIYDRPQVAVYNSLSTETPLEQVLKDAKIPFGPYSLPGNWARSSKFSDNNCSTIGDAEVIGNGLAQYDLVLSAEEDFTGFAHGCDFWLNSCKDSFDAGHLGPTNNKNARAAAYDKMCNYCRNFYNPVSDAWLPTYDPKPDDNTTNCTNARRRCVDKRTPLARWADSGVTLCGDSDHQCTHDATLRNQAASLGFVSDLNSEPKPQYAVYADGTHPLPDNMSGWFDKATAVQKLKWAVAEALKAHVNDGGHLFAQSFSAETLDIALWQKAIYDGSSAVNAFDNCLAFKDFIYKTFPRHFAQNWYTDINTRLSLEPFNFTAPFDSLCQVHGTGYCAMTGNSHTASFWTDKLKSENTTVLGYQQNRGTDWAKFIKGTFGNGQFVMLGGNGFGEDNARRIPLNTILAASSVEKIVTEPGTTTITGKQKSNYGPVDPDNYVGGGANDYRDRIMFGFNQPMQIGDRLISESGNMRGPTDQGIDFRLYGDSEYPASRLVTVPITAVPDEVKLNNPQNAEAMTIYDLQGTDHPDGVYDPEQYPFGSAVKIIGFAVFEILDPSEYTREGESYESGDAGDLGYYQPGQVRGRFVRYIVKPGEVPSE